MHLAFVPRMVGRIVNTTQANGGHACIVGRRCFRVNIRIQRMKMTTLSESWKGCLEQTRPTFIVTVEIARGIDDMSMMHPRRVDLPDRKMALGS